MPSLNIPTTLKAPSLFVAPFQQIYVVCESSNHIIQKVVARQTPEQPVLFGQRRKSGRRKRGETALGPVDLLKCSWRTYSHQDGPLVRTQRGRSEYAPKDWAGSWRTVPASWIRLDFSKPQFPEKMDFICRASSSSPTSSFWWRVWKTPSEFCVPGCALMAASRTSPHIMTHRSFTFYSEGHSVFIHIKKTTSK